MAPADHGLAGKSVPESFESFNLSIERVGEIYRVRVTGSPVGLSRSVSIQPSRLDVGIPVSTPSSEPTRDVARETLDRDDLRRRGERLFRAVFTGPIGENFRTSLERVRNKGFGLRVRLQMDDAPELAALPWEALWDPTDRAFLNDQPDVPVARALNVTTESPEIGPEEPPLRLLALLPEPRGESKISGVAEWRQIEKRLAPWVEQGVVIVDRVEPPTLETLGSRIDETPCDVLHVVAHGSPGKPGDGGELKLEDLSGRSDSVTGGELARALERRTPPRLVVLNACHGAHAALDDAFDGMAQHLLSRGVPAVVAMRTAVSDAAAVSFAVALYSALAEGRTIEAAMVEARRKLSLGEHRTEWSTPVLYLRGDNVRIFDTGSLPVPVRSSAARIQRVVATVAAVLGLGWLGWLLWPGPVVDPCPPPPGLQDLELVKVDPGVVKLEDGRRLIVQDAFCIGTKEVSRRDWQEVTGNDLPRPERPPDWPMTDVTSDEAKEFLDLLEVRDPGVDYHLPTAEQWEYAARAGETTEYFFGDSEEELDQYGNCNNFLGKDGSDGPAAVGSYKPNAWGLYDVHGNVAEWVLVADDTESEPGEGEKKKALRLGGSFDSMPDNCTFSSRSLVVAYNRRPDTGFRVARSLTLPRERRAE